MFCFALPLLILALASCGPQEAPKASAPASPDAEARTSGTFEGKSESGDRSSASFGDEAAVREVFTEDVPMLPGGELIASVSAGSGDALSLRSDLSLNEIYTFYEQELTGQGWSLDAETETMGARTLNASKAGRVLSLFVLEAQGSRRLSLTVMSEG